jgi:hypothetical protein
LLFGLKCGVTDEAVLDRGEVLREEVINDDALCRWPGVAIEVDAREQTVDLGEHLGCVVPAELPARVAQAIGVSVVWRAAAAGGPALPPWVLIANLARLVIRLGRWTAQHPCLRRFGGSGGRRSRC